MKVIQSHPLPESGGFSSLQLSPDAKVVGTGYESGRAVVFIEGQAYSSAYVHWDIQVVRMGESYGDGMQVLAKFDDPNTGIGYGSERFLVGRING